MIKYHDFKWTSDIQPWLESHNAEIISIETVETPVFGTYYRVWYKTPPTN